MIRFPRGRSYQRVERRRDAFFAFDPECHAWRSFSQIEVFDHEFLTVVIAVTEDCDVLLVAWVCLDVKSDDDSPAIPQILGEERTGFTA